jgi:ParB-like chromosome segregation protein Spo0J
MPTATFKDRNVDPSTLIPYEANAKKHPVHQLHVLRAQIDDVGFTQPIIVDEEMVIIVGHGRCAAALLDPPMARVPIRQARGLTDMQKRAMRIADNKLPLLGDWDTTLLHTELSELSEAGIDLHTLGFSDDDLSRLSDDVASSDLDALGQGDDDTDDQPAIDGMVTLSIPLSALDRSLVLDALAAAKNRYSVETTSDALVAVVRDFLNRNPQ